MPDVRPASPSRWNGSNACSRCVGSMPAPRSITRRWTAPATSPASTRTVVPGRVCTMALSTRLATTRSSSAGSAVTGGRLGRRRPARRWRGRRGCAALPARPRRARPPRSSGRTASAWIRDMSSRSPTSLVSRSVSSSIVASNSACCSALQRHIALAQAADRRLDAGERRAQVVRHRLQQCGAQRVGLRQRGGRRPPRRGAGGDRALRRGGRRRRSARAGRRPRARRRRTTRRRSSSRRSVSSASSGLSGADPSRRLHRPPVARRRRSTATPSRPKAWRSWITSSGQRIGVDEVAGEAGQRLGLGRRRAATRRCVGGRWRRAS